MNSTLEAPPTQAGEQITLYYREGNSDKVYQASLESKDGGFVVNFAFGRRGSTLNTGTKTSAPVDYDTAKTNYDKLVREKQAKGYTPGESGVPYQHTDQEQRATGVLPQLLNPIAEADLTPLLNNHEHGLQEKFDGKRVLLQKTGGTVTAINRKGLTIGLASPILKGAADMPGDFTLDGECVGDVYYAFDLLTLNAEDHRPSPYRQRLYLLSHLLESSVHTHIEWVETTVTPRCKARMMEFLRRDNKEGAVFKRLNAPYTPGRPASGGPQLKHKFTATLSAVVATVNPQRSVEIRLLGKDGWQSAGNVTIPANQTTPLVGDIIEVRFLYAHRESGALYQPVYLGRRQDVEPHECMASQLKFKSADEDEP